MSSLEKLQTSYQQGCERLLAEPKINEIKKIIKKKINLNIDNFKTSFIERMIKKRMYFTGKKSLSEYISFLDEDSLEVLELNASLSINVTEFFRDPKVWNVFEQKILPEVFKRSNDNQKIRIWSAGCATGEEPYSLAMILSNFLKTKEKQFEIIANDINPTSVSIAKAGKYDGEKLKNIPDSLLSKFVEKIDDDLYKLNDDLKKSINFQVGDIVSFNINPVDVIICRNLLIYYSDDVKDLFFKKFYHTLRNDGFLVLGMTEIIPRSIKKNLFESVGLREKIYQKIPDESIMV